MVEIKYSKSSIYSNTPIKSWYLDFWVPKPILFDPNDQIYTIESKFHLRPDLASHYFYGTEKYWYIFCLRNPNILKDPIFDFTTNTEIYIPNKNNI